MFVLFMNLHTPKPFTLRWADRKAHPIQILSFIMQMTTFFSYILGVYLKSVYFTIWECCDTRMLV